MARALANQTFLPVVPLPALRMGTPNCHVRTTHPNSCEHKTMGEKTCSASPFAIYAYVLPCSCACNNRHNKHRQHTKQQNNVCALSGHAQLCINSLRIGIHTNLGSHPSGPVLDVCMTSHKISGKQNATNGGN